VDQRPGGEQRSTSLSLLIGAVALAVVLIGVGIWLAVRAVYSGGDHSGGSSFTGPAAQLGGHTWTLTSYAGTDGVTRSAGIGAKLQLVSNTQILATDSCKSLGAPVLVTAADIEIVGTPAQATGCANAQEAGVVDAVLTGNVSWKVSGLSLTLTKVGSGTLVYTSI
jgi:hypothetical protein